MDRYFRAQAILGVAVLAAMAAEFSGLGVSLTGSTSIGPFNVTFSNPAALPYVALLALAFLLYRYHIEWQCLATDERDKAARLLDHRLTTAATLLAVLAIYCGEAVVHWRNGWVPHALASGVLALCVLLFWLLRPATRPRLQRLLLALLALLFLLEPFLHEIPYFHWLSIAAIPALIVLEALLELGERRVEGDRRAERLVRHT